MTLVPSKIYINGLDGVEHHFWKYHEPEKFAALPGDEVRLYRETIRNYYIYVDEPNDADDFQGSGNLKTASSKVLWLDPSATCQDGSLPGPSATTPPILEVLLDQ